MAKKSENREETLTITEGMVEKIINGIKGIAEMSFEKEEKSKMKEEEKFKEEQEMMQEEFKRIAEKMKKLDPKTEEYQELAQSLYKINSILTGWY